MSFTQDVLYDLPLFYAESVGACWISIQRISGRSEDIQWERKDIVAQVSLVRSIIMMKRDIRLARVVRASLAGTIMNKGYRLEAAMIAAFLLIIGLPFFEPESSLNM